MESSTVLTSTYANPSLMQGTWFMSVKLAGLVAFTTVCQPLLCLFLSLKEHIPPMYNHQNGFESIAEFLNIIRLGHLRVVASKDIDPCTEVVMDYFIQRSCFHASGSCACRKSPHLKIITAFLVYFTELCCVCILCFVWYTRKALLKRTLCPVLQLLQRYPSGLPHKRRLRCSGY